MLKGFLDRILIPGVGFDMTDIENVRPLLSNIRKLAGIVTYGRPYWNAFMMGDPPRLLVRRYLRWFIAKRGPVEYHALYHIDVAGADRRRKFMARVRQAMARF
jgi:putative NADPH-quinone reductase